MGLIACVPNFSEGRDPEKIRRIAEAILSVDGLLFLDVDPGPEVNRTVMTFAGPPEVVVEAAFQGVRSAAENIDMRGHRGVHPRVGATDVCPLVPLSDVTLEACAKWAQELGKRIGETLGIPVYLYGLAATRPERRRLADIRRGGYEGLALKMRDPAWIPDFGPALFRPETGVTVVGARNLLIAFNIDLDTDEVRHARTIAAAIRESGRTIHTPDHRPVHLPGRFRACQAIGWRLEGSGRIQVSTNLTDFRITPPHVVYDACRELAEAMGIRVDGSEVVGLIPFEALRLAGRHYGGPEVGDDPETLIRIAVSALGLDRHRPFDPDQKILEYRLEGRGTPFPGDVRRLWDTPCPVSRDACRSFNNVSPFFRKEER